MADVQFPWLGSYRRTDETHVRPRMDRFEPRCEVDAATHDRLRHIERLDHDLQKEEATDEQARAILVDAMTRNAYGTASIEGNPMSLADVESLLARSPTPETVQVPHEREILNWMGFMAELGDAPPGDPDAVRALHARLFDGVLDDAGEWKDRPNFVGRRDGTVVFIPAMPERVEPELGQALEWARDADEHPLVRAMVFFHEFEGIHPFRDGNGRLGRALFTWLVHAAGYHGIRYAPVDFSFNADRDRYYAALARVEHDDYDFSSWVAYMAEVVEEAMREALARFAFAGHGTGFNDRQVQLAMWFRRITRDAPRRRVKFGDVHAAFPALNRRTLQEDLRKMSEAGVLDKQGERKGTTYGIGPEANP